MVKVSIVMAVYNEPIKWIKKSVDSIICQTINDIELIIVNDNPNNIQIKEYLNVLASNFGNVKIVLNKTNKGLPYSLNKGIELAEGDYIARMDADDISIASRLQRQVHFLEQNPEIDVCGTFAKKIGAKRFYESSKYIMPINDDQIRILSIFNSPMIHPSVMFRKRVIKIEKYSEVYRKGQDYELWSRLLSKGYKFHNLPEYLLKYRLTKKSLTKDVWDKQNSTGNVARSLLLEKWFNITNKRDIELHNNICNMQKCDLNESELWLEKIKMILQDNYPKESKYIEKLISQQWINQCVKNNVSINYCKRSKLWSNCTPETALRFFKHWILRK